MLPARVLLLIGLLATTPFCGAVMFCFIYFPLATLVKGRWLGNSQDGGILFLFA
jgi:hypothetical protein